MEGLQFLRGESRIRPGNRLSPEQATAERDPIPSSDVYSLGCVLYEMLTGEPPFVGGSAQVVLGKILTTSATPASDLRATVPAHVDAVLRCSLQRLPADRFATAARFADALADPSFAAPRAVTGLEASRAASPWNRLSIATTAITALLLIYALVDLMGPGPAPMVSRYSLRISAAEAIHPDEIRPRIALSPDGSRLVYVGRGEDGVGRLLLRARNQLHVEPVPGTDYAVTPFYSPDGSSVGYLGRSRPSAEGPGRQSVTVVSLIGGSPIQLVGTLVGLDGASWGSDGFIYYDGLTGAGTNGIMRVPEAGGDTELVTVVDTAGGEIDHVWPETLPNGNGLICTIGREGGPDRSDIAVLDMGSGKYRALVRGVAAKYAESGHLLYVTADGQLMAAPFDAKRLELTGESVRVAEGLSVRISGSVDLAVSPSGRLLYVVGAQAAEPHELVWVDRAGGVQVVEGGWFANFSSVAISPDAGQLAVSIRPELDVTGIQQIYTKQLPRGATNLLTLEGQLNYRAAWSPDGRSLVFISDRDGTPALYARRADGSTAAEAIFEASGPIGEVTYSRDGEWLVYGVGGDLYGLRLGADEPPIELRKTPAFEQEAALSPDGRWLAYDSNESGRPEVYVDPFPAGEGRWTVSNDGGFSPLWASSGEELFYKTDAGEVVSVDVRSGETFEIGERRVLFTFPTGERWVGINRYDVAPDGETFLMIRPRGSGAATELIVVENFFEELKRLVPN